MRRSGFRVIAVFIACTALLTACTPTDDFEAGQPLDRDELASLSAELSTEGDEPVTADGFSTREVVYWTEGGSVYHRDRDCYHLKRAGSVVSGSVKNAWKQGKERVCSACGEE